MTTEVIRWTASISGMIAAIMISLNAGRRITGWGFVVFLVCSVSWITAGYLDNDPALAIQNVVLTGINMLGVYRWLIRKDKPKES